MIPMILNSCKKYSNFTIQIVTHALNKLAKPKSTNNLNYFLQS